MSRLTLVATVAVLMMAGCAKRQETQEPILSTTEADYHVTVVIDMSASFDTLMAEQGLAYQFLMAVLDKYFQDKVGGHDQLVISRIAATGQSLLWQGTAQELREEFPDAASFRDFLKKSANPNGSPIYAALSNSLENAMADRNVASHRAKLALFALTDMQDNAPDSEIAKERLLKLLKDYAKCDGVLGIYYVDPNLAGEWRLNLAKSGIKEWRVESWIVQRPELPNFD